MRILSIETSCDETAVSIVDAHGNFPDAIYTILGNALFSQIDIHREYGGVFPAVAKREHAKTLVPMLTRALQEASLLEVRAYTPISRATKEKISTTLIREEGLSDALITFLENHTFPTIDAVAVTTGPGLEPALWVGISFAKALAETLSIPLIPVNHMEGHILASVFNGEILPRLTFPALALLISGGHTELVCMENWITHTTIGKTRDDAVGEAFDKVARMLGLPYPGGPEISARARRARALDLPVFHTLPRPMIDSGDFDFSFSGLKTAVRYAIQNRSLTETEIDAVARDFENAVTDVLLKKTEKAISRHAINTLIVGGGVSANTYIREKFNEFFETHHPNLRIFFPPHTLSTDNSIMIALTGHAHLEHMRRPESFNTVIAQGNWAL